MNKQGFTKKFRSEIQTLENILSDLEKGSDLNESELIIIQRTLGEMSLLAHLGYYESTLEGELEPEILLAAQYRADKRFKKLNPNFKNAESSTKTWIKLERFTYSSIFNFINFNRSSQIFRIFITNVFPETQNLAEKRKIGFYKKSFKIRWEKAPKDIRELSKSLEPNNLIVMYLMNQFAKELSTPKNQSGELGRTRRLNAFNLINKAENRTVLVKELQEECSVTRTYIMDLVRNKVPEMLEIVDVRGEAAVKGNQYFQIMMQSLNRNLL